MEERKLIVPGIYRHFKNKYYATMGIVKPVEGEIIHERNSCNWWYGLYW